MAPKSTADGSTEVVKTNHFEDACTAMAAMVPVITNDGDRRVRQLSACQKRSLTGKIHKNYIVMAANKEPAVTTIKVLYDDHERYVLLLAWQADAFNNHHDATVKLSKRWTEHDKADFNSIGYIDKLWDDVETEEARVERAMKRKRDKAIANGSTSTVSDIAAPVAKNIKIEPADKAINTSTVADDGSITVEGE